MYKKIFLIFTGLIAVIALAILASGQLALGAPSVFISNPSTSTPTANFSFTVGTSTSLSAFGTTTLAVYGSTTIQTPVNTAHAFRIINSASTTVFEVDTINASTSVYGALTVTSCTGCSGLTGGVANTFAYWTSGTAIAATSSGLTWSNFHSTSTATSTMQGPLSVPDLMIKRLTGYDITATSSFSVTPLTSALILTDSAGLFAEYAGASCTNQFIRSLSALGASTCATVVAGDVDLADLTATDATLTFSGAYDGSTARTIGINLGTTNTWTAPIISNTGTSTFIGLGVLDLMASRFNVSHITATGTVNFSSGTLRVSASSTPTASSTGAFVIDTADGSVLYNDGQQGNVLVATSSFGANVSSSTLRLYGWAQGVSTGTIQKISYHKPIMITDIVCESDNATTTGSNIQLIIGTGTATTTATQFCPKGGQTKVHNFGVPRYTKMYIELGRASTTVPDWTFFTINYRYAQ